MPEPVACTAECNEIGPDQTKVGSLVDRPDMMDLGAGGHQTASLAVFAEWGVFTHTFAQEPPAMVVLAFLRLPAGPTLVAYACLVHALTDAAYSISHGGTSYRYRVPHQLLVQDGPRVVCSRLSRSRLFQLKAHFAALFKIYKIDSFS